MARGRMILRQWTILCALQGARFGMTLDELRDVIEDGASTRTVYRDLGHLSEVGFPLHSEKGRWRLHAAADEVPIMPLSPRELLGLRFAEQLLNPLADTEMAGHLPQLRRRLEAGLSTSARDGLQDLRNVHVASIFGPRSGAGDGSVLRRIESAILTGNALAFRYIASSDRTVDVVAEPYSIWYFSGRLFLIALCRSSCDHEVFPISDIEQLEVLDDQFETEQTFDPHAFVRSLFASNTGPVYSFAIDFSPSAAHAVRDRVFSPTQRFSRLDSGWCRMTFRCSGLDDVATWVAGFGGEAVPVRPGPLVERVLEKHTKGLKHVLDRW